MDGYHHNLPDRQGGLSCFAAARIVHVLCVNKLKNGEREGDGIKSNSTKKEAKTKMAH